MPNFSLTTSPILKQKSACLLICLPAIDKKKPLPPLLRAVNTALSGLLGRVLREDKFAAAAGETLLLHCPDFACQRLLLAGLGEDEEDAQLGIAVAMRAAAKTEAKSVLLAAEMMTPAQTECAIVEAARATYRFHCGTQMPRDDHALKRMVVSAPTGLSAAQWRRAVATADGVRLACHLAEQPGNVCTPVFLAQTARALARQNGLRVTVLDEAAIRKAGMGGLLAVAQGSALPPRLIALEYNGGGKSKPVALVGKGVTFDTGGISIKPAAAMDEMKFDMCGAATVFGVILALARAKTRRNVVGIIPACENMPGGKALKPGDQIKAMSGKTIEVLNTDAEGRLILADALTYAEQKYHPAAVIDIATLTGACIVALGREVSGLMGRGEALLAALEDAGAATADPCWRLPIGKRFQKLLKTEYADVANIGSGGCGAGTITAACFLSRFVDNQNWAHLDIAGPAWTASKRATGRPVPLLMRYLDEAQ